MKHVIINLFVFCAILYQLNNYTTIEQFIESNGNIHKRLSPLQ